MADWMTAPGLLPWRIVRMPKVMGASCSGDIREESNRKSRSKGLNFHRTGKKRRKENRVAWVAAAPRRDIFPRSTYCEGRG